MENKNEIKSNKFALICRNVRNCYLMRILNDCKQKERLLSLQLVSRKIVFGVLRHAAIH